MSLLHGRAQHRSVASRPWWWTCVTAATVLALIFGALNLALGDRAKPALAASGSGLYAFGSTTGASFYSPHSSGGNYLISWASMQPQSGSYSWTSLDAALGRAQAAGKTLILRVYSNWSSLKQGTPSWFFNVGGARHYYPSSAAQSRGYKAPVPWDSVFQQRFGDFVRALGQRYNGHSALEFIQITGVGVYGEIYLGSTKPSDFTNSKHLGAAKFWIDTWRSAFPDTDLALMVNGIGHNIGENAAAHAVSRGYYLQSNSHKNTAATRAIIDMYDQSTKIVIEAENGGCRTSTVAKGFLTQMDETFSQGYEIDYLMLCYESFTDTQTRQHLASVKNRLRGGGVAQASVAEPSSTTAAQATATRTPTPTPTVPSAGAAPPPTPQAPAQPTPTATSWWSSWSWWR